jgi:hypothetical protein
MSKRIFTSFAIEDKTYRDFLIGQARNERSPFEFVDMSVKQPWSDSWKTRCRIKIKGCDGVIALVSKNSPSADGQLWEIKCAKEERIPIIGIYTNKNNKPLFLPNEFNNITVIDWAWENIKRFINSL